MIERNRPLKLFRVLIAHGAYRVGDKIQPTGMYRQALLLRGIIEEITDEQQYDVPEDLDNREIVPATMLRRRGRPRKTLA